VLREQGSGTREAFEQFLAEAGHGQPICGLELGSTAAVRAAVVSGQSPTVISEHVVTADIDAGSLHHVRIPGLVIERQLRAVWPLGRTLPPLAQDLIATLPSVS